MCIFSGNSDFTICLEIFPPFNLEFCLLLITVLNSLSAQLLLKNQNRISWNFVVKDICLAYILDVMIPLFYREFFLSWTQNIMPLHERKIALKYHVALRFAITCTLGFFFKNVRIFLEKLNLFKAETRR